MGDQAFHTLEKSLAIENWFTMQPQIEARQKEIIIVPQLNKGGKFVFGWSEIDLNYEVAVPKQAIDEYDITSEGKVILISGSKATGGFVVSKLSLIIGSIFESLFKVYPELKTFRTNSLDLLPYKGRLYTWTSISTDGRIALNESFLKELNLSKGDRLMSIRSSDIAFVMGAKGPLIRKGIDFKGEIPAY